MSYKISPEIFFLIEKGQVLLWNCKTHEQFILEQRYFLKLLELSENDASEDAVFSNLLDAGVILSDQDLKALYWEGDLLARLFHVGTKNTITGDLSAQPQKFSQNYLQECAELAKNVPHFFQEKDAPIINLPKASLTPLSQKLSDVFMQRKTSRTFNGEPVSLEQLSNLLYASFGLIHGDWHELAHRGLKIAGIRKASPSSGGLHAEEAYVVAYNVDGLKSGLYYYRPQDHSLNMLSLGHFEDQVIEFNKQQFYSKGLAFGIYITARLDKYWWKYTHSRTYRVMLLDMGHVSQTCLLAATALGIDTWITGAFNDTRVEDFLGIDGYKESVMLFVGGGHGDNMAFPEAFSL